MTIVSTAEVCISVEWEGSMVLHVGLRVCMEEANREAMARKQAREP